MKFALYEEYIGDQRNASDRRLVAVSPDCEQLQPIYEARKKSRPMMKFILEDWDTGRILQTEL